jgi:hypothetical protein
VAYFPRARLLSCFPSERTTEKDHWLEPEKLGYRERHMAGALRTARRNLNGSRLVCVLKTPQLVGRGWRRPVKPRNSWGGNRVSRNGTDLPTLYRRLSILCSSDRLFFSSSGQVRFSLLPLPRCTFHERIPHMVA